MNIDKEWNKVVSKFEVQFGPELDLEGILFLIGIQVLGKGPMEFSKNQKMDLMHIAICSLLEPYGYYEAEGIDKDGWPHWKRNKKLPFLTNNDQENLIKKAIISENLLEQE